MPSSEGLSFTNDELALMSLFHGITGENPLACKIIEDYVYFIISEEALYRIMADPVIRGELRRRVGGRFTRNRVLKALSSILTENIGSPTYVAVYYDDPIEFIKTFFGLDSSSRVELRNSGGRTVVNVYVSPEKKGIVIGRNGIRARAGRFFGKALYNIDQINIR